MIAVLALGGTFAVHEYLAGAVIAVMLTGGRLLEERAGRRGQCLRCPPTMVGT